MYPFPGIGVPRGGPGGPWPPLAKIFSLAEQNWVAEEKLSVWQKIIGKLKSAETEHGQHSPFPPYLINFSANFVCFQPFLCGFCHIFADFSFLPDFESSLSIFCPILRLAEQCETNE